MVWVVLPETKQVEVYVPGQPMKLLGLDGTLDGGNVLPGFTLTVKDIFAE
jgi:Uma2 family endonuclease